MKKIQFLFVLLFTTLTSYGQFEPCTLTGLGSADGGTDPVECGTTVNYSFQNSNDGTVCIPSGNTPNSWAWCIDNLGTPSFINFTQNSSYPIFFTMTNGVQGEILGGSQTSFTIKWNCNDCTGDVSHIDVMFGCQEEIYQSSIFVECAAGCGHDVWKCVSTDCECIKVCINGTQVVLNNTGGGETFFCFPEETDIGRIGDCDGDLPCRGDGDGTGELPDGEADSRSKTNKKYIKIPDVKIVQTSKGKGEASLAIQLPHSDKSFELVVSDNLGRIVHSKKLMNQTEAVVQLNNLSVGIYYILITDGNYRITQKVFVN